LTAEQFDTEEESTMSELRSMSQTADGQMKALQVGHQIAAQQVAQMQKLRGLVSQQMTMMGPGCNPSKQIWILPKRDGKHFSNRQSRR
jgi:P-type conjugative transfer protein TrbJ